LDVIKVDGLYDAFDVVHDVVEIRREGVDVLAVDEAHLDVDLGELRLPIEPEILVAEALDDLEVAIEPGHHEELLEKLGGLGQSIEAPR